MPDNLPRRQIRISQRVYSADGRDRGIAALLSTASWLLGRLPGLVVQGDEVAGTLAAAEVIIIEVRPLVGVRIKSGDRLLLNIPAEAAAQRVRNAGRWSRT